MLHEHCGEAGAIGAALEAIRLWRHGARTTFIGLDAADRVSFQARVRRRDALPLLHQRVRPDVHRRVDRRTGEMVPPGAVTEQFAADRRFVVAGCEKGAARTSHRCGTSRRPWTR